MHRTIRRTPGAALASAGLVAACLLLGTAPAARADDEGAPEPESIQWAADLETGRTRAGKDGRLIFLYFGRHSPR